MRTILYILQKEFIQIFRNKTMVPIIFLVPIVQLVILVNAATLEMKHIKLMVVDMDMSRMSRQLISKFEGSPFYRIQNQSFSIEEGQKELLKNGADLVLHIPQGFEKNLIRENKSNLQLLINSINGTAAGLINAYSENVIRDFNSNIISEQYPLNEITSPATININHSYWYNPKLNYKIYMVPGILVILVTIIAMFLTALNLVREKEIGTIEQINVTPIRKHHFIIGKLVPFWIIAMFELTFGLIIGFLFFDVPMVGSFLVLFVFASIYIFLVMGLGLFLSTAASTQQQVMFLTFFFMVTFIFMSGIFTPVESMPKWANFINIINPIAYFMKAIRMIMLKGSGFADVFTELISMLVYAILAISLAVWRYRKIA